MSSPRRRPRGYLELVHHASDGRRPTLKPGCWAVVSDPSLERPLALGLVSAGPHYQHEDGHAIAAFWQLHDGSWRSTSSLTRLDLAGVLEDATAALAAIRRGQNPETRGDAVLRTHRAACLARRALPQIAGDAAAQLEALIALDVALADLEQAWRDMVRTRLPNLARALAAAAACELARLPGWTPGEGRPHPAWGRP